DEPVHACPPSPAYRFRKFARRNKAALVTAGLVTAALVLAVVVLAVSNVWVTREKDQKAQALENERAALAKAREQEQLARHNAGEAKKQEGIAQGEADRAREQERLAHRRFYAAQMNLAQQAWNAGNKARVLELLESQRPRFDEEELRSFEWYSLWRQCHLQHRLTLTGSSPGAFAVVSPDGKT